MHSKLLNLFFANKGKGQFRAEGNVIFLYDVIVSSKMEAEWWGGVDSETFTKTLQSMEGDVTVRINSPGGDVFAAVAMAAAIREHAGQVTAMVDGYAASAASFITAAADRVVMAQGSMLMIHEAWTYMAGNKRELRSKADLLEKIDMETVAASYVASAARRGVEGMDAARFLTMIEAETWLTGPEAIDAGLADEVSSDGPKAKVTWDFSAYEHAPAVAPADSEPAIEPDDGISEAVAPTASYEIERRRRIAALRLKEAA